jgi:hypothetical protein
MTNLSPLVQKNKGLFRYLIENIFCYHNYTELYRRDVKDLKQDTIEINVVRECTICGKTKYLKL